MTAGAQSRILDTIQGHARAGGAFDDRGMLGDVGYVVEAARWAWVEAWERVPPGPAGGDSVDRRVPDDDCHVPGPKWALGIGNHLAQHALHLAGPRLSQCDASLDACCLHAFQPGDERRLPVRQALESSASLEQLLAATSSISWRLRWLRDRATILSSASADRVLVELDRASKRLLMARSPFEKAMRANDRHNPTSVDPGALCDNCKTRARLKGEERCVDCIKLCIRCGLRPKMPDHARCNTCHTYRKRNGSERPLELDADREAS